MGFSLDFRQSNMASSSSSVFDPSRRTCRGDIFLGHPLVCCFSSSKDSKDSRQVPCFAHTLGIRPPLRPTGSLSTSPLLLPHHLSQSHSFNLQPGWPSSHCDHHHASHGPVGPSGHPGLECRPFVPPQPQERRGDFSVEAGP